MTMALATRGYLCPQREVSRKFGPGPEITSASELSPEVTGAFEDLEAPPKITGAGPSIPSITSSKGDTVTAQVGAPTIIGAGILTPVIK